VYCPKCRGVAYSLSSTDIPCNTGTVGAIAELVVSVDLMKMGYEVYRALSPASSCDILALKENFSLKFEVRTGRYVNGTGNLYYPKKRTVGKNVAVVTFSDNKIHYIPDLPNFSDK
jgi:hypothetical protein